MKNFLVSTVKAATYDPSAFVSGTGIAATEPNAFWGNVVGIAFAIASFLAFGYMVYGAITWITASGDKSKLETAGKRMIWAAVGLIILGSVWAIYSLVLKVAFGGPVELPVINQQQKKE